MYRQYRGVIQENASKGIAYHREAKIAVEK
jgi:hypothetical protein